MLRAGKAEPLVPGFAASADASVSFDGKTVLFAGKKNADDPWQIWEVAAEGGVPRLVYGGQTDAIRPLWMPDGRVVFAERGADGFALVTAALDGSATLRLSYLPGNFIPDDVLEDGRVLFESGFPLGVGDDPGDVSGLSGRERRGERALRPQQRGKERRARARAADESGFRGRGCRRHRVHAWTSAGAIHVARWRMKRAIASPAGDFAGDVAELPDGRWLLAMRRPGQRHYGLEAWKPGARAAIVVARDADRDLVEPVVVAPRSVPRTFPSALHPWKTGNLLALDARLSRGGPFHGVPVTVRVETQDAGGRAKVLGTAPVMQDGSFFVKVPGDAALRLCCWMQQAGRCARSGDGSGCGAASSASAWAATRGRSARRTIACPKCCITRRRRWTCQARTRRSRREATEMKLPLLLILSLASAAMAQTAPVASSQTTRARRFGLRMRRQRRASTPRTALVRRSWGRCWRARARAVCGSTTTTTDCPICMS